MHICSWNSWEVVDKMLQWTCTEIGDFDLHFLHFFLNVWWISKYPNPYKISWLFKIFTFPDIFLTCGNIEFLMQLIYDYSRIPIVNEYVIKNVINARIDN